MSYLKTIPCLKTWDSTSPRASRVCEILGPEKREMQVLHKKPPAQFLLIFFLYLILSPLSGAGDDPSVLDIGLSPQHYDKGKIPKG